MTYEDRFSALAHPLRQEILLTLRDQPHSVRELTDRLPASQPVISQHLKVLKDAGLVAVRAQGMKRIYRPDGQALQELRLYLEKTWTDFLTDLDERDGTD